MAFLVQDGTIGLTLLLILLLGLGQRPQLVVPVRFESIRNQPILGIDLKKSLPSQVCLVAGTLDMLPAQVIRFVQTLLQLLLDRQGNLQGQRRERFHQQRADRRVDARAEDTLADPLGVRNAISLANVIGNQLGFPRVIADGHPLPADSTEHHSLQQCRPLSRRALAPVNTPPIAFSRKPCWLR